MYCLLPQTERKQTLLSAYSFDVIWHTSRTCTEAGFPVLFFALLHPYPIPMSPAVPLVTAPHVLPFFFYVLPLPTYKIPKLSSVKMVTLWGLSIKFKGSTLFTVAVVTEGGKKKCSELLTNMKHDVVDQPSHTTQMFPAEKDILVTAKF